MYSLNSNTRRITSFVESEAYKWLYDKIVKNEYDVSGNRQLQQLIVDIKRAGRLDKASYDAFTQKVVYNPFTCIIQGKNAKDKKFIATDKIENFFIKYNGVVLPIGFIRDFFEDDYETQAEVDKYIASVVKGQEELFTLQCETTLIHKNNQINELKANTDCVFNTAFSFHFTNILKILLTFITLWVCVHFIVEEDVINRIVEYNDTGAHSIFFEFYWFHIVLSTIVLFFLIFRVIKAIKTIIFYIRWFIIRIRVSNVQRAIQQFEENKLVALREYFQSIIPALSSNPHVITDEICEAVPAAKRQYFAMMEFNCNQIIEKITKLYSSKQFEFLKAYYKDDMSANKRAWRKKIVFHTLLCLLLCFMNIESWRNFAIDTLKPVVIYFGGEHLYPEEDLSTESVDVSFETQDANKVVYRYGNARVNNDSTVIPGGDILEQASNYQTSPLFRSASTDNNAVWDANMPVCFIDVSGFLLTDGTSDTSIGFHSNTPSYKDVNGYHSITFDLGSQTENVNGAAVYVDVVNRDVTVGVPEAVEMLVSTDGQSWQSVGAVIPNGIATNGYAERVAILANKVYSSCRYVQIRLVGEGWTLVSEVDIFAGA